MTLSGWFTQSKTWRERRPRGGLGLARQSYCERLLDATRDLADAGDHRNFAGSPGPDHSATSVPAAAHLAGRSDERRPDEWALTVCTLGRDARSAGNGFRRFFRRAQLLLKLRGNFGLNGVL